MELIKYVCEIQSWKNKHLPYYEKSQHKKGVRMGRVTHYDDREINESGV